MINFDAVDFSERRPEEVISFFWRSVYKAGKGGGWCVEEVDSRNVIILLCCNNYEWICKYGWFQCYMIQHLGWSVQYPHEYKKKNMKSLIPKGAESIFDQNHDIIQLTSYL